MRIYNLKNINGIETSSEKESSQPVFPNKVRPPHYTEPRTPVVDQFFRSLQENFKYQQFSNDMADLATKLLNYSCLVKKNGIIEIDTFIKDHLKGGLQNQNNTVKLIDILVEEHYCTKGKTEDGRQVILLHEKDEDVQTLTAPSTSPLQQLHDNVKKIYQDNTSLTKIIDMGQTQKVSLPTPTNMTKLADQETINKNSILINEDELSFYDLNSNLQKGNLLRISMPASSEGTQAVVILFAIEPTGNRDDIIDSYITKVLQPSLLYFIENHITSQNDLADRNNELTHKVKSYYQFAGKEAPGGNFSLKDILANKTITDIELQKSAEVIMQYSKDKNLIVYQLATLLNTLCVRSGFQKRGEEDEDKQTMIEHLLTARSLGSKGAYDTFSYEELRDLFKEGDLNYKYPIEEKIKVFFPPNKMIRDGEKTLAIEEFLEINKGICYCTRLFDVFESHRYYWHNKIQRKMAQEVGKGEKISPEAFKVRSKHIDEWLSVEFRELLSKVIDIRKRYTKSELANILYYNIPYEKYFDDKEDIQRIQQELLTSFHYDKKKGRLVKESFEMFEEKIGKLIDNTIFKKTTEQDISKGEIKELDKILELDLGAINKLSTDEYARGNFFQKHFEESLRRKIKKAKTGAELDFIRDGFTKVWFFFNINSLTSFQKTKLKKEIEIKRERLNKPASTSVTPTKSSLTAIKQAKHALDKHIPASRDQEQLQKKVDKLLDQWNPAKNKTSTDNVNDTIRACSKGWNVQNFVARDIEKFIKIIMTKYPNLQTRNNTAMKEYIYHYALLLKVKYINSKLPKKK